MMKLSKHPFLILVLLLTSMVYLSVAFRALGNPLPHRRGCRTAPSPPLQTRSPVSDLDSSLTLTTSHMAKVLRDTMNVMRVHWQTNAPTLKDLVLASTALYPLVVSLECGYVDVEVPSWRNPERQHSQAQIKAMIEVFKREDQSALMLKLKDLFVFYIGAPAVGNWEEFLTSVRLAQRELSLGSMTQAEYDAFLAPHNAALGYDSAELIRCGAPSMQHYNSNHLLTVQGQEQFLEQCEKTDFLPAFKPIAAYFVARLKAMPKREYTDCYVKELAEMREMQELEELEYLDYMDGELDSDELVGSFE